MGFRVNHVIRVWSNFRAQLKTQFIIFLFCSVSAEEDGVFFIRAVIQDLLNFLFFSRMGIFIRRECFHHLSGTGSFIHAGQSPVQGMIPGTFLDMRISHLCGPSSIPVRTLGTGYWALFWEPTGNVWGLVTESSGTILWELCLCVLKVRVFS